MGWPFWLAFCGIIPATYWPYGAGQYNGMQYIIFQTFSNFLAWLREVTCWCLSQSCNRDYLPYNWKRWTAMSGDIEYMCANCPEPSLFAKGALQKHAYSNILKISPPKTESIKIKILIFSYFCSKYRLWVLIWTALFKQF